MATQQSSLKHRRVYDVEQLPESSSLSNPPTPLSSKGSKSRQFGKWRAVLYGVALTLGLCFLYLSQQQRLSELDVLHTSVHVHSTPHVLISYSYFEKDEIQRRNMEFFLTVGFGYNSRFPRPPNTHLMVVINGDECAPCVNLLPVVQQTDPLLDSLSTAWVGNELTMLKRRENDGMDFAAHNASISWLDRLGTRSKYRYFIFLNSSVRGPFVPLYMPRDWTWTQAYTDLFNEGVGVVSSSLVCLPPVDAGGYGPKVESWAFALIPETLHLLTSAGVFDVRTCKLCNDGVVVKGEYGIATSLMQHGWNLNTLMYMYRNVNWLDQRNWNCNNNTHPSRHGTYAGMSMHPMEVVFIKASWHVGEPFTSKYSEWLLAHADGRPTTHGSFDEPLYRYAVTMEAQADHGVDRCYKVV